ncbi:hypothetical protein Scep_023193 [Stephania cephalantha]|uniref:Uncharacterized protein n=1 Tax=Stephania cephalantha TaxID=152367 RepID=A0AAP0HSK1_9MAGN
MRLEMQGGKKSRARSVQCTASSSPYGSIIRIEIRESAIAVERIGEGAADRGRSRPGRRGRGHGDAPDRGRHPQLDASQGRPRLAPLRPRLLLLGPPRKRPYGIAELIGRLATPMSEDESLSLTNVRGWPSSAYFIEGKTHPIKIKRNYGNSHVQSESEDEEA